MDRKREWRKGILELCFLIMPLLVVSYGMAGRKAVQHPGTISQMCHRLVLPGPEHGWPLMDPGKEHAHDLAS